MTPELMTSPYRGLMPYTEIDTTYFFGREQETVTVAANLEVARLTLLYGPSGVGKSSLLRAGVFHQLQQHAQANFAAYGCAESIPIYFNRWQQEPLLGLRRTIMLAIEPFLPTDGELVNKYKAILDPEVAENFPAYIRAASEQTQSDLLLILDQFEEYFLYSDLPGDSNVADALVQAINSPDLRVNFLLSLREDALARLDHFKGRIPFLLDNRLSLERLNRQSARDAIEKPLIRYSLDSGQTVAIEPKLTETILDQLSSGQTGMVRQGTGIESSDSQRIETPYLQLVLIRLWQEEQRQSSTLMRTISLDKLGNTSQIVASYLDESLSHLSPDQQSLASKCFDRLITPSGIKIALTESDLIRYTGAKQSLIEQLLHILLQQRLLQTTHSPTGESLYEITHDILGKAVLSWQERYQLQLTEAMRLRNQRWKQAEIEYQVDYVEIKKRQQLQRRLFFVMALLVVSMITTINIWREYKQTESEKNQALTESFSAITAKNQAEAAKETAQAERDLAAKAEAVAQIQRSFAQNAKATAIAEKNRADFQARRSQSNELASEVLRILSYGGDLSLSLILASYAVTNTLWNDQYVLTNADQALQAAIQSAKYNGWRKTIPSVKQAINVTSASYNKDSDQIVSSSSDKLVQVWDVKTGTQIRTLIGHTDRVNFATYSPNGKQIMSVSDDRTIRVWDAITGKELRKLIGHKDFVFFATYSLNGEQIVSASADKTIRVWDLSSGKEILQLIGHEDKVRSVDFNPNSTQIVSASDDKTIRIWDVTRGQELRQLIGHTSSVTSVEYSANGRQIVSSSDDGTIRIWDAVTGKEIRQLHGHTASVLWVRFSPDNKQIVSASADKTIRVWDSENGKLIRTISGHNSWVYTAEYSSDGNSIVSAGGDQTIRIWDATTAEHTDVILNSQDQVNGAMFSPIDDLTLGISFTQTLRLYDGITNNQVFELLVCMDNIYTTNSISSMSFSPNGEQIAIACSSGSGILWNVVDKNSKKLFEGGKGINSIALNSNGNQIVSGDVDGIVGLWDLRTGKEKLQLLGHQDYINSVAFSPDDKLIASAGAGATIQIWDLLTTTETLQLTGGKGAINVVLFSPNRNYIAWAGNDTVIYIWDILDGMKEHQLVGHRGVINAIAFSPDGNQIVSASNDQTIRIWDILSGKQVRLLRGHTGSVNSVAFSPDGKRIVSTSDDHTVRIWTASIQDMLGQAQQLIQRDPPLLTFDEQRLYSLE